MDHSFVEAEARERAEGEREERLREQRALMLAWDAEKREQQKAQRLRKVSTMPKSRSAWEQGVALVVAHCQPEIKI